MKLLIICHHLPPERNPRAMRSMEIINSLEAHDLYILYKSKMYNTISLKQALLGPEHSKHYIRKSKFIKIIQSLFFPDYHIFTYLYCYFKYRSIVKNCQLILSISNPWSAHLLASKLSKSNPNLKWIMDIGDLYWENPHTLTRNGIWKNKGKQWENQLVKSANAIITNSQNIIDYYRLETQDPHSKFNLVYNPVTINVENIERKNKDNGINLSYIGSTFDSLRTGISEIELLSEVILRLIQRDIHIKVKLYGNQSSAVLKMIEKNRNFSHSKLTLEHELIDAYSESDILLNFSNGTYAGLPSKLIEYTFTGLPIINFISNKNEASIEFLNEYGNSYFHYDINSMDVESVISFILSNSKSNFYSAKVQNTIKDSFKDKILNLVNSMSNENE